jgi:hypothetical protein
VLCDECYYRPFATLIIGDTIFILFERIGNF